MTDDKVRGRRATIATAVFVGILGSAIDARYVAARPHYCVLKNGTMRAVPDADPADAKG